MSNYTFLSGGTGTPKLLEGFRQIVDDTHLTVIANSGDDYYWNSLLICPDLDTLLYLFSERLDLEKYWGQKEETFQTLTAMKTYRSAQDTWFNIGDKDLALHLIRNHLFASGHSLAAVTQIIANEYEIRSTILPMSNDKVSTIIHTKDNYSLHFQEFFVKHRTEVAIDSVEFEGSTTAQLLDAAAHALASDKVIIGPSNPITSIGPMLSLVKMRALLRKFKKQVTVISPIVGSQAFSGPTVKLMKAMNVEPSAIGLAKYYQEYANTIIFDPADKEYAGAIEDIGIEPIFMNVQLQTVEQKKQLAQNIEEVLF